MKKSEVRIGATYHAKVSGAIVPVRILSNAYVGWMALNIKTGRTIHIRGAQRRRLMRLDLDLTAGLHFGGAR